MYSSHAEEAPVFSSSSCRSRIFRSRRWKRTGKFSALSRGTLASSHQFLLPSETPEYNFVVSELYVLALLDVIMLKYPKRPATFVPHASSTPPRPFWTLS